jgi:hypothetical protein
MLRSAKLISLELKGLRAIDIHGDLVATLWLDAVSHLMLKRYLRQMSFSPSEGRNEPSDSEPKLEDLGQAILLVLAEGPSATVRLILRVADLPPAILYWHLIDKLRFTVRFSRWDSKSSELRKVYHSTP